MKITILVSIFYFDCLFDLSTPASTAGFCDRLTDRRRRQTEAAEFDFCGCGWPHHMLLPKGTPQGYKMVLFVMVSNWNEDRIEQDLVGSCNDAASYCGIRDRKYPDRKAMGYPFDRPNPARALSDFLRPNMAVRDCSVNFTDATRIRGQRS